MRKVLTLLAVAIGAGLLLIVLGIFLVGFAGFTSSVTSTKVPQQPTQVAARPTEPGSSAGQKAPQYCQFFIQVVVNGGGGPVNSSGSWYVTNLAGNPDAKVQPPNGNWAGSFAGDTSQNGSSIVFKVPMDWAGGTVYALGTGIYAPIDGKPTHRNLDRKDFASPCEKTNSYSGAIIPLIPAPTPTPKVITKVVTPTPAPTSTPTPKPTQTPTPAPTNTPTLAPTAMPTNTPALPPTVVPSPTPSPTVVPTEAPQIGDFASCVVRDSQSRQPVAGANFKVIVPGSPISVAFGTTDSQGRLNGTALNGISGYISVSYAPYYRTISDAKFTVSNGQIMLSMSTDDGCNIILVQQVQQASITAQSNVNLNGCPVTDDSCPEVAVLRSYPEAKIVTTCQTATGYLAPAGTLVAYRGTGNDAGSIFLRTSGGEYFDGYLCQATLRDGQTVQVGLSNVCANLYILPGAVTAIQPADVSR